MEEIINSPAGGEAGKFIDPNSIIAQLDIKEGSVVADFGCGPGYFSIPFARAVGENGKVHALDVLPQVLGTVLSRAKNSAASGRIIAARVNLEKENGSRLGDSSVDWIILKDILFQNQKKDVIIGEAYRVLKPGGKIIVVEWNDGKWIIGPEKELRISQDDLKKMLLAQKFSIEKNIEAGNFHYAFVAVKNS